MGELGRDWLREGGGGRGARDGGWGNYLPWPFCKRMWPLRAFLLPYRYEGGGVFRHSFLTSSAAAAHIVPHGVYFTPSISPPFNYRTPLSAGSTAAAAKILVGCCRCCCCCTATRKQAPNRT